MARRIDDVREEQLEKIEEIEKACFSMPWTIEQLRSQIKDSQHEFIAALDDEGRVLGYVGMMYVLDEGYISNVAVAPEARRQGIGRDLIKELMARAAALDLAFVTLEARGSNAAAIALYEKQGFVPVGKRKNYYDFPREDAILMTHFLK